MIKRIGSFAVLVLLGTIVLAACGTESEEAPPTVTRIAVEGAPPEFTPTTDPNAEPTAAADTPASGGETPATGDGVAAASVDLEMKDIAFDKKEITIPANTDVTFNLVNNGAATHNFTVTDTEFTSGDYAAGQTGTLVVNLPAGEYEFDCTIPGHKEAGMVGKLIVTEDGGGAAAETTPAAETTAAAESTEAAGDGAAAGATTVDVEMKDIAFDQKEITIAADTDVTFNLVNNGAATHNFSITDTEFSSGDYAAGQTGTLVVNLPAGEYEFDCTIPGHKEAGMVGKLIVTGSGGGEAAAVTTPAAETPAATETTPAAGDGAAAGATTVDVEMKDIAFDQKEITIAADTDVTFNLVNNGAATHNFTITGTDFTSGDYAAGQTGTLVVNVPAGEYDFDCTIPGHKEAGMVGKLIVTGAAGGGDTTTPATAESSPAASPAASPAPAVESKTTFDLGMKDIAFETTELVVPANADITINLVNNGAATHNFSITELNVNSGDYAAGQTGTVTFNAGAPGEYQFFCAIPGHKEAGMVGKLIVVDAAAASTEGGDGAAAASGPVDVEMKDIAFAPTEITIPANTDVTFNLVNNGVATHNFTIVDTPLTSGDYAGAQKGTLVVNLPPGEYQYICAIPGHKEAGMVGKLIVK